MALNLKTNLANSANYGGVRSLNSIKYIVIHYTGNDGDTDENNGTYFKNNVVKASAHYFVDDDSITQSVPDNYVAYHCGASTYKHATCRNANSIGIEICDDVKNGVIYPSAATIANAIELTEYLMKKYSISKENVIRHYDVTGKLCPAYWCGTTAKDALWKSAFWNKLGASSGTTGSSASTGTTTSASSSSSKVTEVKASTAAASGPLASLNRYFKVTASWLNVRNAAGTKDKYGKDVPILVSIPKGTKVRCYGYYTVVNGVKWLYVQFTYNNVKYTGFVSAEWLVQV